QARRFERAPGDVDRLLTLNDRQGRNFDLLAKNLQLFLRGRAIDVERRHQRLLAVLLADQLAELGGRGCLTGALQAYHHDDDGRLRVKDQRRRILAAQHLDQFVVDDLDDLLTGSDRAQNLLTNGLFGYAGDEITRHRKSNVRFQKSDAHFAHRFANVCFVQRAAPAQTV